MMSLNIDMKIRPWNCSGSPILFMMLLNIDMRMIRPVNSSGFSLIFDMNSWTLLQSCNVVNPGKTFHSNSISSPSIASTVLYFDELLNQLNVSSQAEFDVGF